MADFDERLIEAVRRRPQIYDLRRADFKDFKKKEGLWRDISMELLSTEAESKKRWKTIRDRYTREKKMANLPTGSEAIASQKWSLYSQLSFLNDHIKHKSTISNYRDDSTDENTHSELSEGGGDVTDNETSGASGFIIPPDLELSCDGEAFNDGQSSGFKDESSLDESRPVKRQPNTKRKKEDLELEILKNIADRKKNPGEYKTQSSVGLYCMSLVSRIEALEPKKQGLARKKIEDILFELEYGSE